MTWVLLARLTLALLVTLLAALMGRATAHTTGQPRVVGEIAAGLALGPLLVLATSRVGMTAIFPSQVVALLHDLGQVGLVLLVTEVAYGLRTTVGCGQLRSVSWVVVGSSVPSFASGLVLAGGIIWSGASALRAPAPAFVLFLGVSLSMTAVPVLARILTERGLDTSIAGSTAMAAAVVVDAASRPLLAAAVALATGRTDGAAQGMVTVAVGALAAWLVRRALSWGPASRSATRLPRVTCVGVAALALGAAVTEQVGLTAVFGAVLVGLALPDGIASPAWPAAAHTGSRVTSWLVPVFFVASGVTTFTAPVSAELWAITPVVVLLAALSKIGGGYLGARLGGHPTTVAAGGGS